MFGAEFFCQFIFLITRVIIFRQDYFTPPDWKFIVLIFHFVTFQSRGYDTRIDTTKNLATLLHELLNNYTAWKNVFGVTNLTIDFVALYELFYYCKHA